MILECWTRERLGKYISSVQDAGNMNRKDSMVLSETADMEVSHLDIVRLELGTPIRSSFT